MVSSASSITVFFAFSILIAGPLLLVIDTLFKINLTLSSVLMITLPLVILPLKVYTPPEVILTFLSFKFISSFFKSLQLISLSSSITENVLSFIISSILITLLLLLFK